jgi:DNA-directed RNA polymerase sigma subunit (sigma70/sigma32)
MEKTYDDFIQAWKKERAKMTAEMLELRNQGKTYQEIGDKYGITKQRAYQIIKKAVKDA